MTNCRGESICWVRERATNCIRSAVSRPYGDRRFTRLHVFDVCQLRFIHRISALSRNAGALSVNFH